MKYIRRIILMIQFLTSIPLPINLNVKEEDFGKGLVFAPVVGLLLGCLLAGGYYILNIIFPIKITSILIVIIYIILTGGLHIDGLGDTFDGIFSNRPKERILEIMRDSRMGTNGVLAIVCVILLDTTLISAINPTNLLKILILMPVAGRIGSLVSSGVSVYARNDNGLGKCFIDYCGIKEIVAGLVISLAVFYFIIGNIGLLLVGLATLFAFLLVKLFSRKIGGATGDILGAVCELNQVIFLMAVLEAEGRFFCFLS